MLLIDDDDDPWLIGDTFFENIIVLKVFDLICGICL